MLRDPQRGARSRCAFGPAALYAVRKKRECGSGLLLNAESLLDIGFKDTEDCFVPLDRHLQCSQQSLGGEEIHDDPLFDVDRIFGNANGLWIQTKVNDQFFWRTGDAAKIGIQRNRIFIPNLNLHRLLLALCFLCWILFYFTRHRSLSKKNQQTYWASAPRGFRNSIT